MFFYCLVFISLNAFSQSFKVITVPYRYFNTSIPHPAYNGHPVILKAIARTSNPSANFYYRWDADGNGTWDNVGTGSPVAPGSWYLANCYSLEGSYIYPYLDPAVASKKIYVATIEVAETINLTTGEPSNSSFSSYPVMLFGDVPDVANAGAANDQQLGTMRDVAIDDALWYLHKQLTRSGSDPGILGYLAQSSTQYSIEVSGLFLRALVTNGHMPAYKPGTYVEYGTPMQADFYFQNDLKWNNDPYSEDAVRIFNYLLNTINIVSIGSGSVGFTYPNSELCEAGMAISALAYSGMTFTKAQVGDATYVKGVSLIPIMQKFVDYLAYSQIPSGSDTGGWAFSAGDPTGYAYTTGGAIHALTSINNAMGAMITIPQTTKDKLAYFLVSFQRTDGSVPYSRGTATSTFEPVGLFLAAAGWMGWNNFSISDATTIGTSPYIITRAQARNSYDKYIRFIADNFHYISSSGSSPASLFALWSDGNYNSGLTNHDYTFSLHNIRTGMVNVNPMPAVIFTTIGSTINWLREISIDAVRGQLSNGSYTSVSAYWFSSIINVLGQTAMECNTITLALYDPDPVAIGVASPMEVIAGCSGGENGKISFSHSGSYHLNPSRAIAEYQWLFETVENPSNGAFGAINWAGFPMNTFTADGKAYHTSSRDNVVIYRFMKPGTYNAALRVIDTSDPAKSNIYVIKNIVVNAPATMSPVVDAGGPYKINSGNSLSLAGTATNPNAPCYLSDNLVVSWDLNGNGGSDFSSASGEIAWAAISGLGIPVNTINDITLKAENTFGQSSTDETTLTICDVSVDLGADKSITMAEQVTLDAGGGALSYLWSNGSVEQQIVISGSVTGTGTFKFSVEKTFPGTMCVGSDSVKVIVTTATAADETDADKNVKVYPNPMKDWLTIESESGFGAGSRIEIMNLKGGIMISKSLDSGSQLQRINLEILKKGPYIARIISSYGETNISLIKQ
jgi:hypothetical protein